MIMINKKFDKEELKRAFDFILDNIEITELSYDYDHDIATDHVSIELKVEGIGIGTYFLPNMKKDQNGKT